MPEHVASSGSQPITKHKQRKKWLLRLTILFIAIMIACLIYWLLVLRYHQETDDAYVTGNQIQINAQVSGSVNQVNFDNTDRVQAGDVLVVLDNTDAQQAYQKAQNFLANTVRQVNQLMKDSQQYQANILLRQTELNKATNDYQRRQILGNVNAIGREELQHAKEAVEIAKAALDVAMAQYLANKALILETPIEQQPSVLQATAQVRDAWLTLERTQIRTPISGYVSRRRVQVGAQISPSTPLMAIVPVHELWIDANFKETQLADMRIGQPAKVTSDIYGRSVVYKGKIVGLDMGTGSAFSLLPAQNATGNWMKVVQRLAVRIELDKQQLIEYPLRIGLSTKVEVDTHDTTGEVLATHLRQTPAYYSDSLVIDLTPVNQLIANIIQVNKS